MCVLSLMTKTAPAFLTLYNVGDHQSGAGVVASQTSTEKVLFDLEGKQVPGPNTNSIRITKGGAGVWCFLPPEFWIRLKSTAILKHGSQEDYCKF